VDAAIDALDRFAAQLSRPTRALDHMTDTVQPRTTSGNNGGLWLLSQQRGEMRIGRRRQAEHQRIRLANLIQPCRRAAPRNRLVIASPAPNAT
jgi:hypothetical protein